jgi:hypothetical protein
LAKRQAMPDGKPARRPNISTAELDDLSALLENRNLAALDKFNLLAPSLSELLGTVCFERLRDALDNLDFPLGAQLLRESRRNAA